MGEGKKRRSGEPLRDKNDQKRRKEEKDPSSPEIDTTQYGPITNQGAHKIKKVRPF